MDNPTLAELADKVPLVVREGIRGLSDDDRLGLAMALAEGGRMTFSEIKAKYGLNPGTLSSHLSALQRGNLVRNYYEKGIGRAYSYYEATDLPEAVLKALFTAMHETGAVEGRPVRTRGHDPWANQHGRGSMPSHLADMVTTEAQSPAAEAVGAGASASLLFGNAVKEPQYSDEIYRFACVPAGAKRATARGVQNE